MRHPFFYFLVLLGFVMLGCGNTVCDVGGKVTFDDGQPVTGGYVYFDNGALSGRGTIQADGSYSMGMQKDGKGLPPGAYKVYVDGPLNNAADLPEVSPEFNSAETSPLSYNVEAGKPITFDIVVKRNPAIGK